MTYKISMVNVDGGVIWSMFFDPSRAGYENLDPFLPLLDVNSTVDCLLDSPYQVDKRALYRLKIERF